jgi:TolB-like protein
MYERAALSDGLSFAQRKHVRNRVLYLTRRLAEMRAKDLVAQPGAPKENAVAVYEFAATDSTMPYRVLGKGIAAMLITDLKKVRRLTLVERLQLAALIDEIRRGQSAEFDDPARAKAGRMIGAESSVSGSLVRLDKDRVRLSYYVLNNRQKEPGRRTKETLGDLTEVMRLEKDVVFGVIDRMGIELTKAEVDSIGKAPTTSFPAFVAYCEGLELADQGKYAEARAKFEKAQDLDPAFQEAAEQADDLSDATDDPPATDSGIFVAALDLPDAFEPEPAPRGSGETGSGAEGDVVGERLAGSGESAGVEDAGTGAPADNSNSIPPVPRPNASIRVRIRLR